MKLQKVISAPGYPPSRVWRLLYLLDINIFIVIPAKAGIQLNGKIRLFSKPSHLTLKVSPAGILPGRDITDSAQLFTRLYGKIQPNFIIRDQYLFIEITSCLHMIYAIA